MPRLAAVLVALAALAAPTEAQPDPARLYVGPGIWPGTGAWAAAVQPALSVFTTEGAVYADFQPRVLGGQGRLLVAVGAGGAVRAAQVLGMVRNADPGPIGLDLGVRVGPAFYYAFFEQTAEARARAYRVMFDPFARATLEFRGRPAFVELGNHAPQLRAGLAF